jgi:threonine dehydratase
MPGSASPWLSAAAAHGQRSAESVWTNVYVKLELFQKTGSFKYAGLSTRLWD